MSISTFLEEEKAIIAKICSSQKLVQEFHWCPTIWLSPLQKEQIEIQIWIKALSAHYNASIFNETPLEI